MNKESMKSIANHLRFAAACYAEKSIALDAANRSLFQPNSGIPVIAARKQLDGVSISLSECMEECNTLAMQIEAEAKP